MLYNDVMPLGWGIETDVNTDLLATWGFQTAFGQRFGVANGTTADIWAGTTLVRPLPLVPTLMSIVSTSASDTAASVLGARFVQITWIDAAGDWRTSDLLPLNGLTPVPITYKPGDRLVTQGVIPSPPDGTSIAAPIFRIQDVAVILASGSTVAAPRVYNVGTLRIRDTATGTIIFENVPIGYGRASSACFHCPRKYEARLTRVHVGTARGSGRVDINVTFGLGTAWQRVPLVPLNDSAVVFLNDSAATPIEARADLQANITAGSNNIDVSCVLQFRIKPL